MTFETFETFDNCEKKDKKKKMQNDKKTTKNILDIGTQPTDVSLCASADRMLKMQSQKSSRPKDPKAGLKGQKRSQGLYLD